MVRCTPEVLESYFRDYGWSYRAKGKGNWITGWQGAERSYPLRVNLCDTWISFQVAPFLKLDVDWEAWPELSRYLLELNQSCHMVKLALDFQGNISLSLELFTQNFHYSEFTDALGVLAYYADHFFERIHAELEEIGFHHTELTKFLT